MQCRALNWILGQKKDIGRKTGEINTDVIVCFLTLPISIPLCLGHNHRWECAPLRPTCPWNVAAAQFHLFRAEQKASADRTGMHGLQSLTDLWVEGR